MSHFLYDYAKFLLITVPRLDDVVVLVAVIRREIPIICALVLSYLEPIERQTRVSSLLPIVKTWLAYLVSRV